VAFSRLATRHRQRPTLTRPVLTTTSLCAALPGWARGYELHVLVGLALLVMLRLVWMKTGAKSEAVAAKEAEMEKKITAGFCGCLGGVLRGVRPASLHSSSLVMFSS
jgi:hypothetical protein